MISDRLKKLEDNIQQAASIPEAKKKELSKLLASLKAEIMELAKTKKEDAESITSLAKLSTYEATRKKKNPRLLDLSLKGLVESVEEFENSHPKLARAVNAICEMLAKLGI